MAACSGHPHVQLAAYMPNWSKHSLFAAAVLATLYLNRTTVVLLLRRCCLFHAEALLPMLLRACIVLH